MNAPEGRIKVAEGVIGGARCLKNVREQDFYLVHQKTQHHSYIDAAKDDDHEFDDGRRQWSEWCQHGDDGEDTDDGDDGDESDDCDEETSERLPPMLIGVEGCGELRQKTEKRQK